MNDTELAQYGVAPEEMRSLPKPQNIETASLQNGETEPQEKVP